MNPYDSIVEAMIAAEGIQKSRVWFGEDAEILEDLNAIRESGSRVLGYIITHKDHIEGIQWKKKQ